MPGAIAASNSASAALLGASASSRVSAPLPQTSADAGPQGIAVGHAEVWLVAIGTVVGVCSGESAQRDEPAKGRLMSEWRPLQLGATSGTSAARAESRPAHMGAEAHAPAAVGDVRVFGVRPYYGGCESQLQ